MGRLLAIDYGRKRCGIAVTDSLRICANGLATVRACDLMAFLKEYCNKETVDKIIVGLPRQMDGTPSESSRYIEPFLKHLRREMPGMPLERYDERFTSTLAHRAMIDGGLRRMARRDKELVDEIAATIILNDYLSSRSGTSL
ncbi:MAG: Holliday junction resolvase RuvX [Muribaculaceae bacterium]|nr:Holliday junction resolvase RuvX [Muribaculaceae bacterium]